MPAILVLLCVIYLSIINVIERIITATKPRRAPLHRINAKNLAKNICDLIL